jgi:hypothetical protein
MIYKKIKLVFGTYYKISGGLSMSIVEGVRTKLEGFGITIYTDYPLSEQEHLFMADNMLLFVHTKSCDVGVSFQAETRPKTVANSLLIILEIDSIANVDIMESFVIDEDKNFVSGEKAFKIVEKKNQYQALNKVFKEQAYSNILMYNTAGEC